MMRREMLKTPVQVIFSVFIVAMLVLSQGSLAQGAPKPAGKVVFAMGSPHAVNSSGVSRPLAKGDPVYAGDRMITGRGRLQLSMIDGAFISVQPNSEYDIDTYHYDGKPDGTEQATYRLVKGGVRAVTGLIGRVNKDAYKVNTAIATIGIRGTGHNTRICAGDCGNVKDGLYHNTWEGITYVVNDVDTVVVPAGQGVYVQSIDSPIVPLNQAPGVTAAVTKEQAAQEQEKEDQQTADQTTVVAAGNQRTSDGTQAVIPAAKPSHVVSGLVVGGIVPDSTSTNSGVANFGLSNASVFQDPTSNGVIGILGLDNSNNPPARAFASIDYNSALAGDDPAAVTEAGSLLDQVDQATKDTFLANPAQLVENTTNGNLGWGRWANGYFVGANANGDILFQDLTGNQSLHYVYGPDPGTIPTSGTALYNFIGGTQSTSLSGTSIGNGVTDGSVYVDFGTSTAGVLMSVDHNGNMYFVDGMLVLDGNGGNGLSDINALAATTASGSACNPSCATTIEGGFLGSAVASHPGDVALTYDIQETDPITGIGVFATDNVFSSAAAGLSAYTYPYPGSIPSVASGLDNSLYGEDVYLVKNSGGDFIGKVINDTGSNYVMLATIDLKGMLDTNNASIGSLLGGITNVLTNSVITDFRSNPAQVLESVSAGAVSLGRWGNGKILFANNSDGGYTMNMQNDQSYHFINGPDPGTLPTSGGAYYNFTATTHSTTASGVANASGASLGTGVTGGSILVNFLTDSGSLTMDVSHGNQYHVSGPLLLDSTYNNLYDNGNMMASTSATGSACNPDCPAYVNGGLLGPGDSTSGLPSNLGLSYKIDEQVSATDTTVDPIMGAAAFGLGNLVGSVTQKPEVMAIIQPDSTTSSMVDITLGTNAILHFDSVTNNPVGAILTTNEYDPTTSSFVSSRGFGTINLTAMQNSDDPAAQTELNTMVTAAGTAAVANYASNPASLAEFTTDGTIGYGRWANGKLLTYSNNSGTADVVNLTGNQSIHFIYGPDPGTIPTSGSAFYNFIGGTQSTSASGATIGNGVTDGAIYVDFGAADAHIRMDVDHNGNMYLVHGDLPFTTTSSGNALLNLNATAETTASGSACNPSCTTMLEGGFAGSAVAGHPADIGLSYAIQETDPITGVAAFATDNTFSTVVTNYSGLGVYPVSVTLPFPGSWTPPYFTYFLANPAMVGAAQGNVYQITDSNGNYIGQLANDPTASYTELLTNNLYAMLDNNNAALAPLLAGVVQTINNSQITDLMSNPAQVAETVSAGSVSLGRWNNGNVLLYRSDPTSTNSAILPLTNDQSLYYINGPDPGTLPSLGAATYTFTAGTHSTTRDGLANFSGVALGTGVTAGTITVNFVFDSGTLDMTVQHGNQYHATGYLSLAGNLSFGGGTASTTAAGSACNPNCSLGVFGQLLGPNDSTSGLPSNLGITYEIYENNAANSGIDPIIGTAAFGSPTAFSGSVTSMPVYGFTSVQPNQTSTAAHFTDGNTGTVFADPATGALIGVVATVDDPTYGLGRAFGTVDLTAMQNSDNPVVQAELNNLVTAAGTTAVNDFQSNPATVTDSYTNGSIGMGRWTNGKMLSYNTSVGTAEVKTMTGNQSTHFIYGPDPGAIPTTGTATYNFEHGTQSTSLSGATIGNGVTSGSINVNFASNSANLSMVVNHVNSDNSGGDYNVSGTLTLNAPSNGFSDAGAVSATGGTGACASSCGVNIDGGFAGPTNAAGNPSYVGLGYIINENDPITGVAGFK